MSFIFNLSTLTPAIVSQLILIGLGFLYFKNKHPWARILNAEFTSSVVEKLEPEENTRL